MYCARKQVPGKPCLLKSVFVEYICIDSSLVTTATEWQPTGFSALLFLVRPYGSCCHWPFVTHHCQCLSSVCTWRPSFSAERYQNIIIALLDSLGCKLAAWT